MATTRKPTSLPNGIQNIALTFSGGGFRAAAFSLGCSSYLYATPYGKSNLLSKVQFIASTSGGTITNLVLAQFLREGKDFEDFFKHLLSQISGTRLIDGAMRILRDDAAWRGRPEKSRNLINAFAMIYDRDLFREGLFGLLFETPDHGKFYIDEHCANTVELNSGINFRFSNKGVIGNTFLKGRGKAEHKDALHNIKLGDILAASSCFPGGFEPILYPKDFSSAALDTATLGRAFKEIPHFNIPGKKSGNAGVSMGFLDGGIDDNQGIYAFLKSNDRKRTHKFDLFLSCDVSSNFLGSPYREPKPNPSRVFRKSVRQLYKSAKKAYLAATVLCLSLLLGGVVLSIGTEFTTLGVGIAGIALIPTLSLFALWVLILRARKRISGFKPNGTWATIAVRYAELFADIPVGDIIGMAKARASSIQLLVGTLFLKKIRRISYSLLYAEKSSEFATGSIYSHNGNPSANPIELGRLWNDHIGLSALYTLSSKNKDKWLEQLKGEPWEYETAPVSPTDGRLMKDVLQPSPRLRAIIDSAVEMETTLWFDASHTERQIPQAIVIAGQATMCFQMLLTVHRFSSSGEDWESLKGRLALDWEKFCDRPGWLYNDLADVAGSPKWNDPVQAG